MFLYVVNFFSTNYGGVPIMCTKFEVFIIFSEFERIVKKFNLKVIDLVKY